MNFEFVKGKMGVEIKGEYYNVFPLPYNNELMEPEEAYITDDLVLPYHGVVESINEKVPGYYGVKDGEKTVLVIVLPDGDEAEKYSVDKVINFDIETILDNIKEEDLLTPEEVEMINMSSDYRIFEIKDDDDFLKKIVKTIINEKKVNLKVYASRLPERHQLGNMITSLSGKTKMSVAYFKLWSEMLGFDFTINAFDNGTDRLVPMTKEVHYNSITNDLEEK